MKNFKKVLFFSSSIMILPYNTSTPAAPKQPVLKCENVSLLNEVLTLNPIATLKINLASKTIWQSLRNIKKIQAARATRQAPIDTQAEEDFVKNELSIIMKPVKVFFDKIIAFRNSVKPIIEESLSLHKNLPQNSLLKKFINSKNSIEEFCDKEIKTLAEFKKISTEILYFFTDLNKSLSQKAKKAYEELLEKVTKKPNTTGNAK